LAAVRLGGTKAKTFQRFLERFYARVPADDIVPRPVEELYAAALSLWQFAEVRPPSRAKLRVLNPRTETHGWHAPHTLVQIVNDDMPFLVDSVAAAINASGLTVHLVIHPIVRVERSAEGRRMTLLGPESDQGRLESLMHFEVSAQSDPAAIAALEA